MSSNIEGFKYEEEVVSTLVESGFAGNITEGAGASSAHADADIVVAGEKYLVEVKKDLYAQMGGTSIRYVNGSFEPVGVAVADEETYQLILSALEPKREAIEHLLDGLGVASFPSSCEKKVWNAARSKGLLKPVNTKVRRDTSFLVDHYSKKGVDYIQIGGAGLFYLKDNPANLPVPQLKGKIDIELRAGRSGSRLNADGIPYVGASLRAQGRLKFEGSSPYTLDNKQSIIKMLEVLNEKEEQ